MRNAYLYGVEHSLQIDNRCLVEECINGDKEALNLFYTRFAPMMLGVIRRYVPDTEDAEDILHDGFIVAYTRLASLRDFDRVEYWLATIMKNLSLQFLHAQDVTKILHDIPEVEDTPEIDDILGIEVIESLILKLPPGYQKVFRLAVLENKSHKEIGKLLGIAPNSSSSQLFHAKLMMRRLITEYKREAGITSLLFAVLTTAFFLLRGPGSDPDSVVPLPSPLQNTSVVRENNVNCSPVASSAATARQTVKHKGLSSLGAVANVPSETPGCEDKDVKTDDTIRDIDDVAVNDAVPTDIRNEKGDSVSVSGAEPDIWFTYEPELPAPAANEWALGIRMTPGILNYKSGKGGTWTSDNNISSPGNNEPNGGSDNNFPGSDRDDMEDFTGAPKRSVSTTDYNKISHHNYMPLTVALTSNKCLNRSLSFEAGVAYTYLRSRFEHGTRTNCHWHYIGFPVKLNYTTVTHGRLRLYAAVGGQLDIPLFARAVTESSSIPTSAHAESFDAYIVWSLSASYGVSYRISNRMEIFVEPTMQYHFKHRHDIPNSWTDSPFTLSLPFGIRLNW